MPFAWGNVEELARHLRGIGLFTDTSAGCRACPEWPSLRQATALASSTEPSPDIARTLPAPRHGAASDFDASKWFSPYRKRTVRAQRPLRVI